MATPVITLEQVSGGEPVPVDQMQIGSLVTASDTANTSGTYSWEIVVPPGSSTTLSDPAVQSPTFTPDVSGTYLLFVTSGATPSFTLDASGNKISTQGGCAVRFPNGVRAIGRGESGQFGDWSDTIYQDFKTVDDLKGMQSASAGSVFVADGLGGISKIQAVASGKVLTSQGVGSSPAYEDPAGSGANVAAVIHTLAASNQRFEIPGIDFKAALDVRRKLDIHLNLKPTGGRVYMLPWVSGEYASTANAVLAVHLIDGAVQPNPVKNTLCSWGSVGSNGRVELIGTVTLDTFPGRPAIAGVTAGYPYAYGYTCQFDGILEWSGSGGGAAGAQIVNSYHRMLSEFPAGVVSGLQFFKDNNDAGILAGSTVKVRTV